MPLPLPQQTRASHDCHRGENTAEHPRTSSNPPRRRTLSVMMTTREISSKKIMNLNLSKSLFLGTVTFNGTFVTQMNVSTQSHRTNLVASRDAPRREERRTGTKRKKARTTVRVTAAELPWRCIHRRNPKYRRSIANSSSSPALMTL